MKKRFSSAPSSRHKNAPSKNTTGSAKPQFSIPRSWRTVVGFHALRELLATRPKTIEMAWIKEGFESSSDLKDLQRDLLSKRVKIEIKPAGFLDKFSASHQGAIFFSSFQPEIDWSKLEQAKAATVMVLDGLEDPHNLGAIVRTSWLMGVDGVLIPQDRSAGLTATVHKVACGGVEHVPVEAHANFSKPIEDLKKNGFWVFGLSHEGKQSLFDLKIPEKVVWCVGSEDKGLRTTTERLCDELVRIPQANAAASYNASVAAAIALTETLRSRTDKTDR